MIIYDIECYKNYFFIMTGDYTNESEPVKE